jgi:AbrB family looped-hinge helix DNA binding protein
MKVSIDRAGRVVIPKAMRRELGLSPDNPLDIDVVDGHIELSSTQEPARIVQGPHGPLVAATGTPISDEEVRELLEATRERR